MKDRPRNCKQGRNIYLPDFNIAFSSTPTSALLTNTCEANSTDDKYFFYLNKYIKVLILKSPLTC